MNLLLSEANTIQHRLPDGVLLGILAVVSWLAAGDYLTASLIIWGDHPGQFMRFWYPQFASIPQFGSTIDWMPYWYAGYPELQFYPPGHVFLCISVQLLSFGLLSAEQAYNAVAFLAFVLPAFTFFFFLRVTLAPMGRWSSRLAGLSTALFTLSFTPMWGGVDAVAIGLMGERLAFGVSRLVLLAGWWLVEKPGTFRLVIAALLLSALLLLHPFHGPAVVLAVIGYAVVRRLLGHRRMPRAWLWLGSWILLSLLFIAVWLVPLLSRYSPYAAALIRADPAQVLSWLDASYVKRLWVIALPALLLLRHQDLCVRATVTVLILLLPLLALSMLATYGILINRLDIVMLDPVRFMAGYYLILLLLTGASIGATIAPVAWRRPWPAVILVLIAVVALGPVLPKMWRNLQHHAHVPLHSTLAGLQTHPAYAGFWEALRFGASDGRVLFVSYYQELVWEDGTVTPTTINSMAPYFSGREIIGGTFSHWSPVARLLWVGDPWRNALPERVELEDDRSLFGIAWEEMDSVTLAIMLQALNVTLVVAHVDDIRARAVLDQTDHFQLTWNNGHFYLYTFTAEEAGWIQTNRAKAQLQLRSPQDWLVEVSESAPGATLDIAMTYYPLWRADINGEPVPIQATEYGLQRIQLPEVPERSPYLLRLRYRKGVPEWIGLMTTVLSLGFAGLLLLRR